MIDTCALHIQDHAGNMSVPIVIEDIIFSANPEDFCAPVLFAGT